MKLLNNTLLLALAAALIGVHAAPTNTTRNTTESPPSTPKSSSANTELDFQAAWAAIVLRLADTPSPLFDELIDLYAREKAADGRDFKHELWDLAIATRAPPLDLTAGVHRLYDHLVAACEAIPACKRQSDILEFAASISAKIQRRIAERLTARGAEHGIHYVAFEDSVRVLDPTVLSLSTVRDEMRAASLDVLRDHDARVTTGLSVATKHVVGISDARRLERSIVGKDEPVTYRRVMSSG